MLNILTITAPIYLAICTGYVATRSGFFSKPDMHVLGRFVLNFALPAMLFNALSQRDFQDVLHPSYLLAYTVGSLLAYAIGFVIWRYGRRQDLTLSALVAMGVSCSNSGYVGYPILLQILGPVAGVGMALTVLIENLVIIPLGLAMADSGESAHASWQHTVRESFKRLLKIPMLWGIVGGFVFSMMGWQLPAFVFKAVNAVGGGAHGRKLANLRGVAGQHADDGDFSLVGTAPRARRFLCRRLVGDHGGLVLHHQCLAVGHEPGAGLASGRRLTTPQFVYDTPSRDSRVRG